MTSLTYFNQEKRKIQEEVNSVVDQLNQLKKVNVEDAESVQTLIEDIIVAGQKLSEEQDKFRALVFEHYSPVPDEGEPDSEEDVDAYEEEEPPQQQVHVEPDPTVQQNALLQNLITGVTALVGAYTIFKSMKK